MSNKLPLQVQAASPKGAGQGAEKGATGEKLGEWLISFKQTLQPGNKTGQNKHVIQPISRFTDVEKSLKISATCNKVAQLKT